MKLVLREDIGRLGKKGDVVNVAPGYARNFLIPRKLALKEEDVDLDAIRRSAMREEKRKEEEKRDASLLAEKLKSISLTIPMKAGDDDRLYGSVNEQHIVNALKEQGVEVDKKKIAMEEPLKLLGVYNVPLKLSAEVTVNLKVWVVKE